MKRAKSKISLLEKKLEEYEGPKPSKPAQVEFLEMYYYSENETDETIVAVDVETCAERSQGAGASVVPAASQQEFGVSAIGAVGLLAPRFDPQSFAMPGTAAVPAIGGQGLGTGAAEIPALGVPCDAVGVDGLTLAARESNIRTGDAGAATAPSDSARGVGLLDNGTLGMYKENFDEQQGAAVLAITQGNAARTCNEFMGLTGNGTLGMYEESIGTIDVQGDAAAAVDSGDYPGTLGMYPLGLCNGFI
jgi:hypothetical protein